MPDGNDYNTVKRCNHCLEFDKETTKRVVKELLNSDKSAPCTTSLKACSLNVYETLYRE